MTRRQRLLADLFLMEMEALFSMLMIWRVSSEISRIDMIYYYYVIYWIIIHIMGRGIR